jgi:signal transduction histidine kinase
MRYRLPNGQAFLVIGLPLELTRPALYFEATPLDDIEDTLDSVGLALLGAAAVTTLAGAGTGVWASQRVLRPLDEVGQTTEAIAAGDLTARLEVGGDLDLAPIAASFNDMAENLEQQIERDAQFASNVSHELRSPLMTIMASLEVLKSRKAELDEKSQVALDLLDSDLARFRQLVEDLLEISRYDVSAGTLEVDHIGLIEFLTRVAEQVDDSSVPVVHDPDIADLVVEVDKRRLSRVVTNLLQNASNYAGGATEIMVSKVGDGIEIAVQDRGPGVPLAERQTIFDRFARGAEGGRRGYGTGTGLGLALVAEHVRLHGGRVRVTDRGDGEAGACFVVELPGVIR